MAQPPPFYWNYNAGAGYNAQNDPAYWSAQAKYQEDKRNSDLEDQEQQAEDLANTRQANLVSNTDAINNGFDTQFGDGSVYNQYAKDLMGYWQPDIDQQYSDASRQLNYTFADAQPGGGSAPAEAFGRLKQAYDKANLTATDNAQTQANQLKTNVEGQRSALLAGVSGDTAPGATVANVTNTIGSIPLAPTYSPIGDIFSNLTGQYAVAAQAARNGQPGFGVLTPFGSSSDTSGAGSQKIIS